MALMHANRGCNVKQSSNKEWGGNGKEGERERGKVESRVAQGKRGGLITRRAVDRNHSLLTINSFCAIREKNRIQSNEETHAHAKATNRSDLSKQANKQTSKHSHGQQYHFVYCRHRKRMWIYRFFLFNYFVITFIVCVCVCVFKDKKKEKEKRLQHSEFPGCLQPQY